MAGHDSTSGSSSQQDAQITWAPYKPRSSSARIESFQDISDLDYHYQNDEAVSPPTTPLPRTERNSYGFPPTEPAGPVSGDGRLRHAHRPSGSAYQPVGRDDDGAGGALSAVSVRSSTTKSIHNVYRGRLSSAKRKLQPTEPLSEGRESVDIALLPAAAPIDGSPEVDMPMGPSDTTPTSPSSSRKPDDEATTKLFQQQERAGHLTGGLGAGLKPPANAIQIREEDLPKLSPLPSPILQRMPTRAKSLYRSRSSLGRSATRKALGQSEANRTGQAVQVIVEEETPSRDKAPLVYEQEDSSTQTKDEPRGSKIDLSFVAGDGMPQVEWEELRNLTNTRATIPIKKIQRVETFYPTPNWKPFSMRWPYLLMLIILSFVLAALTEVLYQHSALGPLIRFSKPSDIGGIEYFSIKFLPTILAVIYGVLWQMTDFDVKRLEAYYQLSRQNGATAADTLNVDYITSYTILAPLSAFRRRHYAVLVSSLASILAISVIPTLCSASIVLTPNRAARIADPDGPKQIWISAVYSRINEAVLILIALLGCVLFYQLSTRRSGLVADVKGIAGLAAMANKSHILMDFKDMDVATHEDIHKKLANYRYILRNSSLAPLPHEEASSSPEQSTAITNEPAHPLMFRAQGAVPLQTALLLFTLLLPLTLFTPSLSSLITAHTPWLLTLLAVALKLAWSALDTTTRLTAPYHTLYKRHAPPRTLTLDYTAMPFAVAALRALASRHWVVASVGVGTVLAELLTVLVSSLATVEGRAFGDRNKNEDQQIIDAGEETPHSFFLSLGFALAILLYLLLVSGIVYIRRRTPFLPRQPNTIASVLAFLHQSKMLYDFVDTEEFGHAKMRWWLDGIGKRYGLGWFEGRDGRIHCGVDEEELSAGYRHGVDISRSNQPWVQDFTEWL